MSATTAPAAAQATAPPTSASGAALIEASLANLSKTLHPYPDAASYTGSWIDVASLVWGGAEGSGGLLAFDWDSLTYRPAMARDMPRVSQDGKTFTFTLRDDLKWSDGSPVTVDDFQFAYDQASREENRYVQLDIVQDIASYRSVDKSTIEVTLRESKPRDVALGIANVIGPVPKRVWEGKSWTDTAANSEILTPSVVLGPFKIQEFKIAERGVFLPLDTYAGGKPRVSRVELLANQQPTVAYESLKSGRANWIHPLPAPQYADAKATADLDVKEWIAANAPYRTLEFNLTRPFLSDKRVREALSSAVNRADLVDLAEQGLAAPQYSFIPPTNLKWVNNNVEKYDYLVDRSRQLLADAGYQVSDGRLLGKDGQQVKLQVLFPTSSSPRAKIAAYLQQQYRELGIDVEVKGLDFNAYTDLVQNRREYDISLATYGGGSLDPDLGPKAQLIQNGQQNVTGYASARVDDLFKQASVELDEAKRKQLYDQLQVQVASDLPSHYLYALKAIDAFSRNVQGVAPKKGDRLDYNDALLGWSVAQ
ncbi:MAG TPA: ABC transporter substrate-binding protein [Chloroflexota bacterium]|nr:ABC transporter substrate-binding protein [Chloroflexota bacterium]